MGLGLDIDLIGLAENAKRAEHPDLRLTEKESEAVKAFAQALDADCDGVITPEEYQKHAARLSKINRLSDKAVNFVARLFEPGARPYMNLTVSRVSVTHAGYGGGPVNPSCRAVPGPSGSGKTRELSELVEKQATPPATQE